MNRQMSAAVATANAIRRLKAAHPEDWERFYGDAREAEGLPRQTSPNAVQAENAALRRRLAELEDRLSSP